MSKLLTLVLVCRGAEQVLLGLKKRGFGEGKWNGFGGKVELGESVREAAARELQEEAGITPNNLFKKGHIFFDFVGVEKPLEVHIYKCTAWSGDISESEEMAPRWFDVDKIPYAKACPIIGTILGATSVVVDGDLKWIGYVGTLKRHPFRHNWLKEMASRALSLLRTITEHSGRCPCHGGSALIGKHVHYPGCGHLSTTAADSKEYAFEMATSTIRFGPGTTAEVGFDLANLGAKNVMLVTDAHLATLLPVKTAMNSLTRAGVRYSLYSDVRVEPTDSSVKAAIAAAKAGKFDAFLAVGGGSAMDTAKAANLYSTFPSADFLDFVNAPVGKGLPVPGPVKPLIAVPTTSGTGSETTGVAIFDYEPLHAKTGIANRMLRPTLGIVDPLNMATMPKEVAIASGFDVFCHALESFTAIPYNERTPRPVNPNLRPAYQGSNPVSDVWALHALQIVSKYFIRSVRSPDDEEARSYMALAAAYAGVGFGNAGVHLAHGMSYPIAGLNKTYKHPGYNVGHSIIPHGISVIVNAPAVFRYTAPTNPERHLQAASMLGADTSKAKAPDAGAVLADTILRYMHALDVPDGLSALGYSSSDIPKLVQGTLPQKRVLAVAPKSTDADDLHMLFENTMRVYV